MTEDEAKDELQAILAQLTTAGVKTESGQLESWLQQIRNRGKGYFMRPEAVEFIAELKMKYEL